MWIVHHWRMIGYSLLWWVILSVPIGVVTGRMLRKLGDDDHVNAGFRSDFMPLSRSIAHSRNSQHSVSPPSSAP